ncbi:restriction endonuclease subunit S [Aerococcus agrisoli]|uniref:Restriction endonuclease subunit S n=1 Tax=Aerococcus agrisoli TaxID=2487350 RepID=A0A3N4GEN3_9LACT|nr:restriction endonuclease subunit S [Aerococcus agrisoli]RPA60665.1 restriction endonuclease subunit S [Aerococcus agrisoli]
MADKQVPELRFKGFTEDWEQRKLGEISESYSGGTPSVSNHSYYGGSIPFIRSAEINSKNTELYLTDEGLNNSSAKLVEVGDILYALYGATSGEVGISQINGAINQAILAIQPKCEYDSNFIMQWLRRQKNSIISTYLQGGQGNLSGGIVKDLTLYAPTEYEEQKKIGTSFKQIDDAIALHHHKLELLKQAKQGFLQQMFPKEGEKVPELRFANFSKEWEQRKLDDNKDVRDGTHDSPKYHQEGHPLVTSKNLNDYGLDMNDVSLISDEDFEAINKRSKVDNGDILFGMIGTIGNPVIVDRSDFAIKNVALIKEGGNIPNRFLIQLLKSPVFKKYIRSENAGNTQKFLGLSKIREFTFFTPTIEEQKLIGTFFKQLDDTIALHQEKLIHLESLKKSYLQKMFI